jgi:hypothetical protein
MIVYFKEGIGVKAVELGEHQVTLLEELGQIQRTEGGGLFGKDFQEAMLTLIEHPSALVCDFCSAVPIRWLYKCQTIITHDGKTTYEHDDWTACETCAALIESNDWDGLIDRAAKAYYAKHPEDAETAAEVTAALMMMQSLYESFRKNRTGERKAV